MSDLSEWTEMIAHMYKENYTLRKENEQLKDALEKKPQHELSLQYKNVVKMVDQLRRIYHENRGQGSTYLLQQGVYNTTKDAIVILASNKDRTQYKNLDPFYITLDKLDIFRGIQGPVAIDNHAMILLLDQISSVLYEFDKKQ